MRYDFSDMQPNTELINREKLINKMVHEIEIFYDNEQKLLHEISMTAATEGEIREAAGNLVEHVLQCIFDLINKYFPDSQIVSKVGSTDYLSKTIEYMGRVYHFNTIQVDRHVWGKNKRLCFIENKTYLDSCYYDRALADFRKIAQSLYQHGKDPADCKYIVFAGQNAAKEDTILVYQADFWNDTKHLTKNKNGLETKIFFFLKGKRSSSKPLYNNKHELNKEVLKEFILYILNMLQT